MFKIVNLISRGEELYITFQIPDPENNEVQLVAAKFEVSVQADNGSFKMQFKPKHFTIISDSDSDAGSIKDIYFI